MILSGRIMLEYLGWTEAADLIREAIEAQVADGRVTYDLHRSMAGAEKLGTSEYAREVIERIERLA
jgi:isocitrate dehydrogenase